MHYVALHRWLNRTFPRTGRCEFCARTSRPTQYASIGHRYTRCRHDYFELCQPCHAAFDTVPGRDLGAMHREKTHCPRGHAYDAQNTYRHRGERHCRECKRGAARAWKRRQRARA